MHGILLLQCACDMQTLWWCLWWQSCTRRSQFNCVCCGCSCNEQVILSFTYSLSTFPFYYTILFLPLSLIFLLELLFSPFKQIFNFYFRPVRLRMNLKTNMEMVGKRFPYIAKYKVRTLHWIAQSVLNCSPYRGPVRIISY